jgi:RecB family exonuclease
VAAAKQLALLLDEEVPQPARQQLIAAVRWSYSRRETLEQCPRRYYYEYFGANKRTAIQQPGKERLRLLKRTENRYLRTGKLLHLAIGQYFCKAQQGQDWAASRLISWIRRVFQADLTYSRAYPGLPPIPAGTRYPPVLLREYIYQRPEADALCAEAEERMANALATFFASDCLEEFRLAGRAANATIERNVQLKGFPCKVTGKIDLAYTGSNRVTIVDWKLGAGDASGADSLQLAGYGLWAVDHFQCAPEVLRVCKVHLTSGEITDFDTNTGVLAAARLRILQDSERMATLEAYGRDAVAEAFTPCLRHTVCRLCPFEGICYAGD